MDADIRPAAPNVTVPTGWTLADVLSSNLSPLAFGRGSDNVSPSAKRDIPLTLREDAKVASHPNVIADAPAVAREGEQAVTFANDKDEPITDAPAHRTASRQFIERKLLERPDDIRAAARNLADEFEQQAKELREGNIPNETGSLAQYEDLLDFLAEIAAGFAELADALDRAFSSVAGSTASSPEPIFLGQAAEIVRWLQGRANQWLGEIGTNAINVPVRVGVLCSGIGFLHWLGADSPAAIGALWWTCKDLQRPSTRK
jgi:hypothetical protein